MKKRPITLLVIVLLLLGLFGLFAVQTDALTVKKKLETVFSTHEGQPQRYVLADVTFDSSYPTGGELMTASNYTMTHIMAVWKIYDTYNFVYSFDEPNQKMLVLYCDYDDTGDDELIEIPDQTDLTGVVARFMVTGF